jgi:hypothetical protein
MHVIALLNDSLDLLPAKEGVARVRGIAGMAGCRTIRHGGKVMGLGLPMTMRTTSAMEEL